MKSIKALSVNRFGHGTATWLIDFNRLAIKN